MRGTQTLETDHLVLRKFTMSDTQSLFCNVTSDEKVFEFFAYPAHSKVEQTEQDIRAWMKAYDSPSTYLWAIVEKKSQEIIGKIALDSTYLELLQTGEIAYFLGSTWWGLGYATECLKAVIDYLFSEGIYMIEAKHSSQNPASGRVLEKVGMKKEAVLRDRRIDKVSLKRYDLVVYSITREERNDTSNY